MKDIGKSLTFHMDDLLCGHELLKKLNLHQARVAQAYQEEFLVNKLGPELRHIWEYSGAFISADEMPAQAEKIVDLDEEIELC